LTRAVNQLIDPLFGQIGYQFLFFCSEADINGADHLDQVFLCRNDLVAVATFAGCWTSLVQIVGWRCEPRLAGLFAQWRKQPSHGS
jgi:hypothetical protein